MPKIVETRILPPGWCLNLFGIYWTRDTSWIDRYVVNHERIHDAQQRELLWFPFYMIYVLEWVLRLCMLRSWKKAYMAISFEREAYAHGRDFGYLSGRRRFAQWRRADA